MTDSEGRDNRKLTPIERRGKGEKIAKLMEAFEAAAHRDENGEYWLARELCPLLGYTRWENFQTAVRKAQIACNKAEETPTDHFHGVTKLIEHGKGGQRGIEDIELTRFACYLIAQNADPAKSEIAAAQTYFAVQTRRQEVADKKKGRTLVRERGIVARLNWMGECKARGAKNSRDYAQISDATNMGIIKKRAAEYKRENNIPQKVSVRDHVDDVTVASFMLAELLACETVIKEDREGVGELAKTAYHCAEAISAGVIAARKSEKKLT